MVECVEFNPSTEYQDGVVTNVSHCCCGFQATTRPHVARRGCRGVSGCITFSVVVAEASLCFCLRLEYRDLRLGIRSSCLLCTQFLPQLHSPTPALL